MAEQDKPSEVNYELNMSFDMLRDNQWSRVLDALWGYRNISGPFAPQDINDDGEPQFVEIHYPSPTATYTQHGYLELGDKVIGVDVLVTRSLFECVSVMTSARELNDLMEGGQGTYLKVDMDGVSLIEDTFKQLALYIYEAAPFEIATIGWNRDCQLLAELISDEKTRERLFKQGSFLAQKRVLEKLNANLEDFEEVVQGLWWLPPQ